MSNAAEQKTYGFDDFRIDVAHLMLYHRGNEIPMVPKAVETLLALIERRGKIVSKDELLEAVWPDTVVEESNLFLYLSLLRKTLGTHKDGSPYVETLRRRGYRFNGEVHLVEEAVEDKKYELPVDEFEQSRANIKSQAARLHVVKNWNRNTTGSEKMSSASAVVPALIPFESSHDLTRSKNELAPDKLSTDLEVSEGTQKQATRLVSDTGESRHSKLRYVRAVSLVILLAGGVAGAFFWRSRNVAVTNVDKPRTIAILPFKPIVADNRDEALELGMADTLITRLGNIRSLTVRSLSSVRNFNNPDQDAIKAGRELAVESVLEASFQRSADRIRVNARLIKVADGTALWANTFDEKSADLFAVQTEIATKIASALALSLTNDETTRLQKRYTNNAAAESYYWLARANELKVTEADLRQAIRFYEQAIKADPNYALAYAHMATAYRKLAITGFAAPSKVLAEVDSLARKALEIDGSLGEAYLILGWLDGLNGDPASAETKIKRGIELNPKDFQAHREYADFLSTMKRHDEAVSEARQARELSPMTPLVLALESQNLLAAGHQDEAILQAKNALQFDPNFWVGHLHLGAAYGSQKRYAEAIVELQKAKELAPGSFHPLRYLGRLYAEMGDKERVNAILKEMEQRSKKGHVPRHTIAWFYNWLGQDRKALDLLERSLEEREIFLRNNVTGKGWDNLRSEPRFQNILKRLNLDN